ncbi:increased DNA methylation 1-like [Impatiens glandulifera]|uniref:increased DNA methylation 1-like n=1 Tax=Impatiens glandulifera TaxID=253017 RepID=UPI001FB0B7BE|nr:increased DNA methylation 1-like [Impatiens glandulifera]
MLLGKEIENLHDDAFDGSVSEKGVISKVFPGNESNKTGKKSSGAGISKLNFNPVKPMRNLRSLSARNNEIVNEIAMPEKKMKLSNNEPSKDDKKLSFCLVESSTFGVISSHLLLRPLNGSEDANGTDISASSLITNESIIELFEDNHPRLFVSNKVKSGALKNSIEQIRTTKGQLTLKKGKCRLQVNSREKSVKYAEEKWCISMERTILSWMIGSRVISINDGVHYRNVIDGSVVKKGLVIQEGILCECCCKVFSLSKFKLHASLRLDCPELKLFMNSGKLFSLCQLDAWLAEYKASKAGHQTIQVEDIDENDDSCGLCGDGGELICCDNCPSTFHQACLAAQEFPEGNWYCSRCICWTCGDLVNESLESSGALKCSLCEHKYHKTCFKGDNADVDMNSNVWFCGNSCQEVYLGLNTLMGRSNIISDNFSWTLLKCILGDQKDEQMFDLMVECNSKLAVAITIMEECFLAMLDPRTGINMIPQLVYNWGSEFARLDYHGFYTAILEMDDVVTAVASIRIHEARVAEMPLIATCDRYRRQGMCRRLMDCIEKMLYSLKVEMFVISAVPSLVETWVNGFSFQHMDAIERRSLSDVNLMVFPGTVWLKKQIYITEAGSCKEFDNSGDIGKELNFMELSTEEIASLEDDGNGGAGDRNHPIDVEDEDGEENGYNERKSSPSE